MFSRAPKLILFLLLMTAPSAAQAGILWDNGLPVNNADFWSYSFTSTSTGVQRQIADDFFLFDGATTITGARWTGALIDSNGSYQEIVGDSFAFDLLILSDMSGRPSGTPIDPVPGTALAHEFVNVVGTTPLGTPYGGYVAEYEVSFDPITLSAGRYWLVIAARGEFARNGANPGGWLWTGRAGTGNAWQGGTNWQDDWIFQQRQQDFELFGNDAAVPEPKAIVVWALIGACGIGMLFRRARV